MRVFNELVPAGAQEAAAGPAATTGRYLVLLEEGAGPEVLAQSDLHVLSTADFEGGILSAEAVSEADAVVFPNIGVALVDAPPENLAGARAAAAPGSAILAVEPERVCEAIELRDDVPIRLEAEQALSLDYLRGYRDAVRELAGKLVTEPVRPPLPPPSFEESQLTWGLQAIRAHRSSASGTGARVAVLDTGLFAGHPDLAGRTLHRESFITGETPEDVHGHGTHCVGTACGSAQAQQGPRYGVAPGAEIFMGKVLNNQGRGGDGSILAGIEWAIQNGCHVVSMSLGAPVFRGQGFSSVYEVVARRALAAGTLIVAAAGNDSDRQNGMTSPVSHPANCPSILAVGAIDARFRVAAFSNQGINLQGGEVDVAAPGVNVRSAWPAPLLYRTISGTSMATPHVAGLAALLVEATGDRGADLWKRTIQSCIDIGLTTADGGAGLVQAP